MRRLYALILAATLTVSCMGGTVFASDQKAISETEEGLAITSGDLYDAVQVFAPELKISETKDGGLQFTYEKDNILLGDIQRFLWKAAKIINIKDVQSYQSVLFFATGTSNGELFIESLSFYDIKGSYDFSCILTNIAQDDYVKNNFDVYFNNYFGAHTPENKMAKLTHQYDPANNPLPDKYQNGYLWGLQSLKL